MTPSGVGVRQGWWRRGLFAVYSDVQFRAPVSAGGVLEVPDLAVEAGRPAG